jgi:hypothetical protein
MLGGPDAVLDAKVVAIEGPPDDETTNDEDTEPARLEDKTDGKTLEDADVTTIDDEACTPTEPDILDAPEGIETIPLELAPLEGALLEGKSKPIKLL